MFCLSGGGGEGGKGQELKLIIAHFFPNRQPSELGGHAKQDDAIIMRKTS